MIRVKTAIAVVVAVLLSITTLAAPAVAARVYNADTNTWEDVDVTATTKQSSSKRGSSIPKQIIDYKTSYKPGTIIVETSERRLYFVLEDGKAIKYGVGVGREGFTWSGKNRISRTAEWPSWTPPAAMRKRVPDLPAFMPGGPDNPLGARAIYIGATLYRIHGTSEPWTIGQAVSSGCIRMTNEDVIDLYERVKVGATVVVNQ